MPSNQPPSRARRRKTIVGNTVVRVTFKDEGDHLDFPAVVAWVLRDGVAWVQPGYLDPWGVSRPQFHRVHGEHLKIIGADTLALVENDRHIVRFSLPKRDTARDLLEAFARYDEELVRQGRNRKAEATKLVKETASDLRKGKPPES